MSLLWILIVLQLVLPIGLLLWFWLLPMHDRLGWLVQAAAVGAALVLLGAAGVWTVPPWWVFWIYVALWLVVASIGARRWQSMSLTPRRTRTWFLIALSAFFALYASYSATRAWVGGQTPATPIKELAFPLSEGTYLVVNGGDDIGINAHLATRDTSDPRLRRFRGNGYGVDLVAIDAWGLRAGGLLPADNTAYRIFGRPVSAPCAGSVVVAVDGLTDMAPPLHDVLANLAGNHIILACDDVHVVMAHLRRGSVLVRVGDAVHLSQRLGEVGNSGATDEPHLHIHVQRPGRADAPMDGEPVPARYAGQFLVRGDHVRVPSHREPFAPMR